MGSNGLTSARHDVFSKVYAEKYPEAFDPNTNNEFIYSGSKLLTDIIEGSPLDAGKLVLSPTRTYAPVVKKVIDEITKLNPRPGGTYVGTQTHEQTIVPDFIITTANGELILTLNSANAPELRVSQSFKEMVTDFKKSKIKSKDTKDALLFIKQKIESAKWFIDAIKKRQNTLYSTMQSIMEIQFEFFSTGDETQLKPMILKDIADKTGLDISTISRVASSKYVQTEYGTFLLKFFFSESLSTESGEEVSTREVKKILTDLISGEDKSDPISDQELTNELNKKGYNIARRTVAKYREQMNIPVARLRKEL